MNQAQQFVNYALSIGTIELVPEGRKLKSGRISPYFFNSGLFDTGPKLQRLAIAYACRLVNEGEIPDVLFGPAYKGIPLVAAVSLEAARMGYHFGYAFNRKEAKDHGEGGIMVGHPLRGKDVVVLDDVMTSGTSSGEAVLSVQREGGNVIRCVISFDRQEKGADGSQSATEEFSEKYGVPVCSAANLDDLIVVLRTVSPISKVAKETLPKILEYRERYGTSSAAQPV